MVRLFFCLNLNFIKYVGNGIEEKAFPQCSRLDEHTLIMFMGCFTCLPKDLYNAIATLTIRASSCQMILSSKRPNPMTIPICHPNSFRASLSTSLDHLSRRDMDGFTSIKSSANLELQIALFRFEIVISSTLNHP